MHPPTLAAALTTTAVVVSGLVMYPASPAIAATPVASVDRSGTPYAENPHNPLAVPTWAVNHTLHLREQELLGAYNTATGAAATYLGRETNQPYAAWFTASNTSPGLVDRYITATQDGNPDAMVQIALFGIYSVAGGEASKGALTSAEKSHYLSWAQHIADEIHDRPVAVLMEPDLMMLAKHTADGYRDAGTRTRLVRRAVQMIHSQNPNAAIYLDAGDSDWSNPATVATELQQAGIAHARGFMLGATHYTFTGSDIVFGQQIVRALNKVGVSAISNKHFVIDTSDNGRPYTFRQFHARHPGVPTGQSFTCTSMSDTVCNALGITPTWQTADATATDLPATDLALARKYVDGYLWICRPWLHSPRNEFRIASAIAAAKFSPYYGGDPAAANVSAPAITVSPKATMTLGEKATLPVVLKNGGVQYRMTIGTGNPRARAVLTGVGAQRTLTIKGVHPGTVNVKITSTNDGDEQVARVAVVVNKHATTTDIKAARKVRSGGLVTYKVNGTVSGWETPMRGRVVLRRNGVRIGAAYARATSGFTIRSTRVANKVGAKLTVKYLGNYVNRPSAARVVR